MRGVGRTRLQSEEVTPVFGAAVLSLANSAAIHLAGPAFSNRAKKSQHQQPTLHCRSWWRPVRPWSGRLVGKVPRCSQHLLVAESTCQQKDSACATTGKLENQLPTYAEVLVPYLSNFRPIQPPKLTGQGMSFRSIVLLTRHRQLGRSTWPADLAGRPRRHRRTGHSRRGHLTQVKP